MIKIKNQKPKSIHAVLGHRKPQVILNPVFQDQSIMIEKKKTKIVD